MGIAMNRRSFEVVLLSVICIVGCGQVGPKVPDGTWTGQSIVRSGKEGIFREIWTFKDGKITVDDGDTPEYSYEINTATLPKQIDITLENSRVDGAMRRGIYEIENDILTIWTSNSLGEKRPEGFDTTQQKDLVVTTFRKKQ
jgi:uncharacterized protein (TIGR03067 family)